MCKIKYLGDGKAQCVDGRNPGCGKIWRLRVDEPVQCPGCRLPIEYPNRRGAK